MQIVRTIGLRRLLLAFVLASLIFLLGVAIGFIADTKRIQWSELQTKQQKADYASMQWQYLFLTESESKEKTCLLLHSSLNKAVSDLALSLEKVRKYEDETQINNQEYELIQRNYIVDNLNYWLLAEKTKKECGADYVSLLYFFKKDCNICPDQGVILTHFKKKYEENLLVFPINLDLIEQESAAKIMQQVYNITNFPSIVIEDKKFEGLLSSEKVAELICDGFENKSMCLP